MRRRIDGQGRIIEAPSAYFFARRTPEQLLEQQFADDAGKIAADDLDLFDRPAGIKARGGEEAAPDPKPEPVPEPVALVTTPAEPAPAAAAPAEPAPKKWAGRYEKPEELEHGYTELQRQNTELREAQGRIEKLLAERLAEKPAEPTAAEPKPPVAVPASTVDVKAARKTIAELHAKMGLGDELTDEEAVQYAQAHRDILLTDGAITESIVGPTQERIQARLKAEREAADKAAWEASERQRRQDAFEQAVFAQYPALKAVKRSILEPLAKEAVAGLVAARPELRDPAKTTDEQWTEAVIAEIGTLAQATLRLETPAASTGAPAGVGSTSAASPVPASAARTPSGARSEGPGGVTAPPRTLTGQAKELDDLHRSGFFDPV
jgi:hypothetical protein